MREAKARCLGGVGSCRRPTCSGRGGPSRAPTVRSLASWFWFSISQQRGQSLGWREVVARWSPVATSCAPKGDEAAEPVVRRRTAGWRDRGWCSRRARHVRQRDGGGGWHRLPLSAPSQPSSSTISTPSAPSGSVLNHLQDHAGPV